MRMPRLSEPVLRHGFRHYREAGRGQSAAVNISQELPQGFPVDEGDVTVEEEIGLPLETMEGEFGLFGDAQGEGAVELTR